MTVETSGYMQVVEPAVEPTPFPRSPLVTSSYVIPPPHVNEFQDSDEVRAERMADPEWHAEQSGKRDAYANYRGGVMGPTNYKIKGSNVLPPKPHSG